MSAVADPEWTFERHLLLGSMHGPLLHLHSPHSPHRRRSVPIPWSHLTKPGPRTPRQVVEWLDYVLGRADAPPAFMTRDAPPDKKRQRRRHDGDDEGVSGGGGWASLCCLHAGECLCTPAGLVGSSLGSLAHKCVS